MNTPVMNDVVRLTVPASHTMMIVIRLTTSGVLARSYLTVDSVDDVKMAAEEACNCLIRSSACAQLNISYWTQGDEFHMRAEAAQCDCCRDSSASTDEIEVIRCVLLSMVDDVRLTYEDDRLRAVEICKRLPKQER